MRLLNYRRGFACNSSSTHSVLLDEKLVTDEWSEFGWQGFQIQSADIAHYIWAAIRGHFADSEPYDREQIRLALGIDELPNDDSYVDHQSCPVFVLDPLTKKIDPEFVLDLRKWFQRNQVGVHGGNDNDEHSRPPEDDRTTPYRTDGGNMLGRKSGDVWTMISPRDGRRFRMTFEDDAKPSVMPELVDCKITSYCNFGCRYCYQGSTPDQPHGELPVIKKILLDCSRAGVLEVAFGGGEPTQHPEFRKIVQYAAKLGLIPNVTTRNLQFVKELIAGEWPEIGGVAFSLDNEVRAKQIVGAVALASDDSRVRVSVQIVDRAILYRSTLDRILSVLESDHIRVTWLGYKQTGFGAEYLGGRWNKPDWNFVEHVLSRKHYQYGISLDTAMLSEYRDALKSKYAAYGLTATEDEGVTSCYVDAVDRRIGISSYHEGTFEPYVSLSKQFSRLRRP
jgi:hypothetical protein